MNLPSSQSRTKTLASHIRSQTYLLSHIILGHPLKALLRLTISLSHMRDLHPTRLTKHVLRQAAGNDTSRSDEQDLHPDELHLAIDVGPPTSSEHAEAETPGAGANRSWPRRIRKMWLYPHQFLTQRHRPAPRTQGVVAQQAAGNETSLSDEWDVQPVPDGHHLAIDVGSPTSLGQVEAEIPAPVGIARSRWMRRNRKMRSFDPAGSRSALRGGREAPSMRADRIERGGRGTAT
ncbi:hypothetical protein BJ912DRAFT_1141609 [Pholiota molesta]|nr:hypothetical protein BJ912DRAFT_1141609 [Pholiota molesta]